jgi:hypothetical protein
MEEFNSLMPVAMDEGDIGEHSNDWHNGPIGWHFELVPVDSIVRGLRNNTKEGRWRLKHVHTVNVLCVLVWGNVHFHIDGECSFVCIGVEDKAWYM